jgi:predicted amidohydrolase YtcJ
LKTNGALVIWALLLFLPAESRKVRAQTDGPDVVLVNGRVFTAVDSRPFAQAIAIKGSRILAVGTSHEISALAGSTTRRIDVGGRLVIPGVNDSHVHFDEEAIATHLDFGDSELACTQLLERIRQAIRKAPRGALFTGTITQQAFFDPVCTPAALDQIARETAVVLWTPTLHAAMLNQAATRRLNIRTADPPVLGGWFGKDMKAARWDGVVHEYAWLGIFEILPTDRAAEERRLKRFLDREAQWGVTSITLIEPKPTRRVEMMSTVNSELRVRVVAVPLTEKSHRLTPEHPLVPAPLSDRISVTGVKWYLDGSPLERSAATRSPYSDDPNTSGQVDFSSQQIRAILEEARQRNTQLLFHTAGDRAAETLLRAMEQTGGGDVWPRQRLRVEHGDGLMPDLLPRARKLGLIVVQNPTHLRGRELLIQRFGPLRDAKESPLRSLLAAGISVVLASDGEAGGPELNPYLNIMIASHYPGRPQESLTRAQAVIAYTRTAAYAEFADDKKGTIEPGKLADLAVLSQDIFNIPAAELPKTESVLTMVDGKIVYADSVLGRK